MNWQYLLSGGIGLYIVETASSNHSDVVIAILAFSVCLIPALVGELMYFVGQEHKPGKHASHLD